MKKNTPEHDRMRLILKRAREEKGLSRKELSLALGMYEGCVGKYERGERGIRAMELLRIAEFLGVDTESAVKDIRGGDYLNEQDPPLQSVRASVPLAQKLGLRPYKRLHAINPPHDYLALLEPLPEGVKLVARVTKATNVVHVFITKLKQLSPVLTKLRGTLQRDAVIWISWPRRSAKQLTDVNADAIQDVAESFGLTEGDLCVVDAKWTGLQLVARKKVRS